MEEEERAHIVANYDKLLRNTKIGANLLATLRSSGILGGDDVEAITSSNLLPSAQVMKFYDILMTRTNSYSGLIDALAETKQSGAVSLLREIQPRGERKYLNPPKQLVQFLEEKADKWAKIWKVNKPQILILTCPNLSVTLQRICETVSVPPVRQLDEADLDNGKMISHSECLTLIPCCKSKVAALLSKTDVLRGGKVVLLTEESEESLENLSNVWKGAQLASDTIVWEDLSDNFQQEILQTRLVTVQGRDVPLSKVYLMAEDTERKALVSKHLGGGLLAQLISNKSSPTILFKNMIAPRLPYYIPRKLASRAKVNTDLLTTHKGPDILLFSNMERHQLSTLVRGGVSDIASNQIRQGHLSSRFILLQHKSDFQQICGLTQKPVHWLKYSGVGSGFTWVQSKGDLSLIQSAVAVEGQQELLTEEALIFHLEQPHSTTTPVLISDTPGMGKSVLLENLGRRLSQLHPERLVLFIVISEFVLNIKSFCSSLTLPEAILDVLSAYACPTSYSRQVFKSGLTSGTIRVELLFDALDEVHERDLPLAMEILQIARSMKRVRVFATTRPHLLPQLEVSLQVMGYNMEGFSESDQIQFLTGFWNQDEILEKSSLERFTKSCLTSLKNSFSSKEKDIAGLPLQCLLIGEVYQVEAVRYAHPDNQLENLTSTPPPVALILSVRELYEQVVHKKLNNYAALYAPQSSIDQNQLLHLHAREALCLLFPEWVDRLPVATPEWNHLPKEELLKVGILEQTSSGSGTPRFIHRTFAEYLAAWGFLEMLHGSRNPEIMASFFYNSVLESREDLFKVGGRRFARLHLPSRRFVSYAVVYFINLMIDKAPPRLNQFSVVSWVELKQLVIACLHSNFPHIFTHLQNLPTFSNEDASKIFDPDLLFLAVSTADAPLMDKVLSYFRQWNKLLPLHRVRLPRSTSPFVKDDYSLFHLAVRRGDYSVVESLLKTHNFQDVVQHDDDLLPLLLHVCLEESLIEKEELVRSKIDILNLILSINTAFLEEKNEEGETLLVSNRVHADVLLSLISWRADLLQRNSEGDTLLHTLCRSVSPGDYFKVISAIPDKSLRKLLKLTGAWGRTPIQELVANCPEQDNLHFGPILDRFASCRADFNGTDRSGHSLLGIAVMKTRSGEVIRQLLAHGANPNQLIPGGKSLLHVAANIAHLSALKVGISLGFDVNRVDSSGNTPLHDALVENYCYTGYSVRDMLSTIQLLVQSGGNMKVTNGKGQGILHLAAKYGDPKILRYILKNSPEMDINLGDETGLSPLFYAVQSEHPGGLKSLRLLLKNGANANERNSQHQSLLHTACHHGHLNMVTYLLQNKLASVNARDGALNTALHYAVLNSTHERKVPLVKFLLSCGAILNAVNDSGQTALHWATSSSEEEAFDLTKFLVKSGGNVNIQDVDGNTLLHNGLLYHGGDLKGLKVVHYLVTKGASLNLANARGVTPLGNAYHQQKAMSLETVHYLVSRGAGVDPEMASELLRQILFHQRRIISDEDTVKFCEKLATQFEGSVEQSDSRGNTILHVASARGWLQLVKICVGKGVSANTPNSEGDTSLHLALLGESSYQREVVVLLREHGGDISALNKSQLSPLQNALTQRDPLSELPFIQNLTGEWLTNPQVATLALAQLVCHPPPALKYSEMSTLVKLCVQHGADLNYRNQEDNYSDLLHLAASGGSLSGVRILLEQGLSAKSVDSRGNNALHHALFQDENLVEIVSLLVEAGVELNCLNRNGFTPLETSLKHQEIDEVGEGSFDLSVLDILVQNGAVVSAEIATLGLKQCICRRGERVEDGVLEKLINYFVSKGASMSYKDHEGGNTLLHLAARWGSISCLGTLLRTIEFPPSAHERNNNGESPLLLALSRECCQLEATRMLLNSLKDPVSAGAESLSCALASGPPCPLRLETLQYLQSVGAINSEKLAISSLKHLLSMKRVSPGEEDNYQKLANLLVSSGASLNMVDREGSTLLHFAAQHGSPPGVRYLLRTRRIDVNAPNSAEDTPLYSALLATENQLEVVKILVESGGDVSILNKERIPSLLQILIENPESLMLSTLSYLMNHGAVTTGKIAALAMSRVVTECEEELDDKGYSTLAESLLQAGADLGWTDEIGNGLLHWATLSRSLLGVKFLLGKGVNPEWENKSGKTPLRQLDCYLHCGDPAYPAVHGRKCSREGSGTRCQRILEILSELELQ